MPNNSPFREGTCPHCGNMYASVDKHIERQHLSTPTTSSTDDTQIRKIVVNRLSLLQVDGKATITQADEAQLEHYADEVMALIVQDREARERKTLETVAAMTGGGSSAQEALDTIKFYAHNKLFAINNPIPDSKAKA